MSEKNFPTLCDSFLEALSEEIEKLDKNSQLDVEYSDGILNILIEKTGATYVINRHSATQKIWYSSPISGADYFAFDNNSSQWLDNKGSELTQKLLLELQTIL